MTLEKSKMYTKGFAEGFLLSMAICLIASLIATHALLSYYSVYKECTISEETSKILTTLKSNILIPTK